MIDVDERVAWLTARLDHLEHAARVAGATMWLHHPAMPTEIVAPKSDPALPAVRVDAGARVVRDHILLHDPRSVLARVDADRRILARHVPERRRITLVNVEGETNSGFYVCVWCYSGARFDQTRGRELREWPCDEIRDLLSAHRYAPRFRGEWLT